MIDLNIKAGCTYEIQESAEFTPYVLLRICNIYSIYVIELHPMTIPVTRYLQHRYDIHTTLDHRTQVRIIYIMTINLS